MESSKTSVILANLQEKIKSLQKNNGEVTSADLTELSRIVVDAKASCEMEFLSFSISEKQTTEKAIVKDNLLQKIADNYPNSYLSIIEKDFTVSFSSGQEFKKQNLNPKDFYGLSIKQIFGEHAPLVNDYYTRTFNGEECSFELFINNQYQHYKTVPLFTDEAEIQRILVVVENISEKKKFENKTKESEERFRTIIENADAGYFFIDKGGIIRDVNDAWVNMYKYSSPKEIIGSHFTSIQKVEDSELAIEFVNGIMDGNKDLMKGEFSRKCKDGSIGYHTFSARPVLKEGVVIGIEGFIIDSTERKAIEDELKSSKEQLQNLFDNMNSGFALQKIITDEQGKPTDFKFIDVNNAFEKQVGIGRDKIIGKNVTEIVPGTKNDPTDWIGIYGKVALTRVPIKFENYSTALGRWYSISAYSPKKKYFATIFDDITEKKKNEDKLQSTKFFYENIIEGVQDGIWVTDQHDVIYYVNDGIANIAGVPKEEIEGKNVVTDFAKETSGEFLKYYRKAKKILKPQWYEVKVKTPEGRDTWQNGWIIPQIKNGLYNGIITTIRDITKRKIIENKLKESEALLNEVGRIAKIGGWEMDLINRTAKWTKGTYDIVGLGYDADPPGPDEHVSYYLPEYQALVEKSMLGLVEKGIPLDFEAQLKHTSGEVRWCKALARREMKGGKCVKVFGTFQDITEQKKVELWLKENEERLSAFFNSSLFGTVYGDIYGGIHKANDKYLDIIGYSREEVESGKVKWDEITPKEYLELDAKKIKEAQKHGVCTPYEKQYIRKDGSRVWVLVGYILRGKKKDQAMAFTLDIQKTKEYHNTLEKRNKFIQTILDNMPLGLATNDFDSGDVTYINEEFEKAYGWPSKELTNVADFFLKVFPDEEYRKKIEEQIMSDIQSGDPSRMKWKNLNITTSEGQKRIVDAVNIPIIEQNNMISTVRDVTEIRKAEQELHNYRDHLEDLVKERTEQLEQKNKKLEHFNQLFVGREFRIKELKEKIKDLNQRLTDNE